MYEIEHVSFYDLLGVSKDARKEEIERACVRMWYRYQCLRHTPLWDAIAARIDVMRTTLLYRDSRAAYDKLLAEQEARRQQDHEVDHATEVQGHPSLPRGPDQHPTAGGNALGYATLSALRGKASNPLIDLGLFNAGSTSYVFYKVVGWVGPESWAEIQSIGLIVLAFGVATTLLSITVVRFAVRALARADARAARMMANL
jgi:hypothetical protein